MAGGIRAAGRAMSNFVDYAAHLGGAVLLGNWHPLRRQSASSGTGEDRAVDIAGGRCVHPRGVPQG